MTARRVMDRRAPALRFQPTPIREEPGTGYRTYRGVATMGDVVLRYRDESYPDGYRLEYRPASVALADEAVASLRFKVLTPEHPREFLNIRNTARLAGNGRVQGIGAIVTDARRDGDDLVVEVMVYTQELDDEIQGGLFELSPGYECKEDPTPGTHPTEGPFHVRQAGPMVYNHLSAVGEARTRRANGDVARLDKLDAVDAPGAGALASSAMDEIKKLLEALQAAIMAAFPDAPVEAEVEIGTDAPPDEAPPAQAMDEGRADAAPALPEDVDARLAAFERKLDAVAAGGDEARIVEAARRAAREDAAAIARDRKIVVDADPSLWDDADPDASRALFVCRFQPHLQERVKSQLKARLDSADASAARKLADWFEETAALVAHRRDHADRTYAPRAPHTPPAPTEGAVIPARPRRK